MGVPQDKDAKRFYRVAGQRLEDAEALFELTDRTTAAMYLAGYCVECVLKALVVTQAGEEKDEVLDSFRGSGAHNYDWLRSLYLTYGGPQLPKEIVGAFRIVEDWGTDLRYEPGTIPADDLEEFLAAVRRIWDWADGRL